MAHLESLPLEQALWWFIENATPESDWRTEVLERLRSRRSAEQAQTVVDEDPDFPVRDWQYEVAIDDTRSGYREWVANQHECLAEADQAPDAAEQGTEQRSGP